MGMGINIILLHLGKVDRFFMSDMTKCSKCCQF